MLNLAGRGQVGYAGRQGRLGCGRGGGPDGRGVWPGGVHQQHRRQHAGGRRGHKGQARSQLPAPHQRIPPVAAILWIDPWSGIKIT